MFTFTVQENVTINRPIDEVFAFVADPTNDPRWCPPVLAAEQIAGDGPEQGARFRQTVRPGPKELTSTLEIVEYEPHRRLAWRGSNDMLAFHGYYELEPLNGGTRLFMSSSLEGKGIWRLLMPIIGRASSSVAEEELQNLKQLLEAGAAADRPGRLRARAS